VRVRLPGELDGALHRRGGRTVVVAGGDRHLHAVVAALHRRNELDDALLAVLPDGTGFACGAGIPAEPDVAAKTVLAGVERRFDLIVDCRGSVVVNAVRMGRSPARDAQGWWRLGGRDGFGDHGLLSAFGRPARRRGSVRPRPLHVHIEADNQVVVDFDRPVWSVAITNGSSAVSSAFASSPPDSGSPVSTCVAGADGYAELVVGFAVDPLAAARHWLRRPHPVVRTDIQTVRAREIKVCGQRFWMSCDGQDGGTEQRCTWKVVPKSLRMVVPAA
jgi:diacylglycerol kinase (ATP)